MQLRDPRAPDDVDGRPDDYVSVQGDLVAVGDDGTFSHEAIDEAWARDYADRKGVAYEQVVVGGTCEVVKSDGEVCGRDLPCPYHD
jgi:hypothetical protein